MAKFLCGNDQYLPKARVGAMALDGHVRAAFHYIMLRTRKDWDTGLSMCNWNSLVSSAWRLDVYLGRRAGSSVSDCDQLLVTGCLFVAGGW